MPTPREAAQLNGRRTLLKRGLLAAAGGALVAAAPGGHVMASADQPMLIGMANDGGTSLTSLLSNPPDAPALRVINEAHTGVEASGKLRGLVGSSQGIGVVGAGVIGVHAAVIEGPGGRAASIALQVSGRCVFTSASLATVRAGRNQATVSGQIAPPGSLVLATVQGADPSYHASARRVDDGAVRIFVDKAAPKGGLRVAVFVLEPLGEVS